MIFNTPLCEICQRECRTVPYLVKDICEFIQEKCLDLEGIFRKSASSIQATQLRKAYEERSLTNETLPSICIQAGVDGHTAANVLKQFLRQLPVPLIPDEVLKMSLESNCLSDDAFANKVRSTLFSWPAPHRDTLQYLLSFLQPIMRNQDNRMNVTGLAVVFGPNVFRIPVGAESLEIQSLANRTFERLLLTSDVICDVKDDQGYLNMTPSPSSPNVKPSRPAPPVPLQTRPLPPPPVPDHVSTIEVVVPSITSSPSVPVRSKSLNPRLAGGDSLDSNFFTSGSYSEHSDIEGVFSEHFEQNELLHNNSDVIEEAISNVVRRHLFTADSSSSCQEDDMTSSTLERDDASVTSLLPSLTGSRNRGPKRRKPSRQHRRSVEELSNENEKIITNEGETSPVPISRKSRSVTLDSNTNEQVEHRPEQIKITSSSEVLLPSSAVLPSLATSEDLLDPTTNTKRDVTDFSAPTPSAKVIVADVSDGEKRSFDDVTEVPPLDLSGVMSSDEVRPKPLPRKEKDSPSRIKRRKRKRSKSSPNQMKTSPATPSDPISIPTPKSMDRLLVAEDTQPSFSPPDGSLKWRDAWSTDEEGISTMVSMENGFTRSGRHAPDKEVNIEFAPSSPENRVMEMHSSKRRLQRRHHHRSNRMSRESPDTGSAPESQKEDDYSHLVVSLDKIQTALRANRQDNGRPEDLTLMTREQIRSEKLAMQRELLNHEEKYGRPVKKIEKDIMRGVYERYRMVKRLLADSLSLPFNVPFAPSLDDVRNDDYDVRRADVIDEFAITQTLPVSNHEKEVERSTPDSTIEASVSISGNLSVSELRKQQKEAKGQRKRLRRRLKEFEKEIEQQYDRKITQADKVVMATEYQELKALKAKIRLLEALINKSTNPA